MATPVDTRALDAETAGTADAPDAPGGPEAGAPPVAVVVPVAAGRTRRSGPAGGLLGMVERRVGLTPVGLAVAVSTIGLWFGGRAARSRGLALSSFGLGAVLVAAWALGRRNLSVDTDRSDIPSRMRAHKPVNVRITLTAKRRLSGIIIEEQLDEHLGTPVRVAVPVLPGGQSVAHEYGFSPIMRGIYKVGPLFAEWSDPFGLTKRRQQIAPAIDVIVHPGSERVMDRITSREWEDPPIRPPVSKPWPTGFEFYGMREYVHGDDPRRIVWRALAQYDKYLVREAEQGITDRVNIYLNSEASAHSPGKDSETFETGVRVAASLASKHLKDGFSVSLDVNSERLANSYRGQPKLIPMLDRLAAVQREPIDFTVALDRLFADPHRSSHNVVITPGLSQQGAARLRLLLQQGASMLLVLVVWDDTDPLAHHRAGSLGCNVVEVTATSPLQTVFAHVVSTRR
ncbi:MAG: hypothetical protein QOI20_2542 [Acidimicrobiaceae bacterium]|nr:hypothetical protein [Acidimicrobiaceae bacterium]